MRNEKVQKLTLTALMAALSYVIFTFLQIKVTLPGGSATSFHLGNAVVVLAALLLGGVYGGIGGAIGMTIGDLLDPIYITGAPKTFFLKLMIGVITGLVAHKLGKITYSTDRKHVFKWTVLAACAGMPFNFIFDLAHVRDLKLVFLGIVLEKLREPICAVLELPSLIVCQRIQNGFQGLTGLILRDRTAHPFVFITIYPRSGQAEHIVLDLELFHILIGTPVSVMRRVPTQPEKLIHGSLLE